MAGSGPLFIIVASILTVEAGWTFYGPYYSESQGYMNNGPYTYRDGTKGANDALLTDCVYDQIGKIGNYMWVIPTWTSPTGAIITYIDVMNLKTKNLASIQLREGGVTRSTVTFNIYTKYGHGAKFHFTMYGRNPNGNNANIKPDNKCVSAHNG